MESGGHELGQILRSCDEKTSLSRWWIFAFCIVLIYGFTILITITAKGYLEKPPIPEQIYSEDGSLLFTGQDVRNGQEIFLRNGLMSNGTVWGHGSYLGPDFSALTLHWIGQEATRLIALKSYGKEPAALPRADRERIEALVPEYIRVNRYNPETGILVLGPAETEVFLDSPSYWREYLSKPTNNGGLQADLITNEKELRDLSAYFTWMAWASVAPRPGTDHSYTNNFPFDPLVGNRPIALSYVWSAISLVFLLVGLGLTLFVLGMKPNWSWHGEKCKLPVMIAPSLVSPSQGALVKFIVVIAFMLFLQTMVGGGVAHYRADPGNFYGFDLSVIFPSSLLRTWHLQLMIFWVATGFVTGGLFLSRILGGEEYKTEKDWVNLLFIAFVAVIGGSLLCEWIGIAGVWPKLSFWLGSQGWEYLEIGRLWQYLLVVGLLGWFLIVVRNALPALENPSLKPLAIMFLIAAFAIPFFYLPALFYTGQTHYTVVDTWRFWIIHLWVEGFFELFATTMLALVFVEFGFVSKTTALRLIFLDGILILMGGIIGTGHHWYFSGMTTFNMTLSGWFSALEIVPLVILCVDAGGFWRTTKNTEALALARKYKWALMFFLSVGFWNFLGAGVFGFLINMPIISYFEIGTYLTPNHGHASMFGVFGLLALGLCTMVLRQANDDENWEKIKKYIVCSFWGFNIGLMCMLIFSLIPAGVLQMTDVIQNGYWHARSPAFVYDSRMALIGWLRMPGDLIFILGGAIPYLIAACKTWQNYYHSAPKKIDSASKLA